MVNIFESPGMNKTEKEILLLILEEQKEQTKILRTIASNTEQKSSGPGGGELSSGSNHSMSIPHLDIHDHNKSLRDFSKSYSP